MHILFIRKLKRFVLDFIFPKPPEVMRAERMTADEMFLAGEKSEPLDDSFITAIFNYRDPFIKALIWEVKYHQNEVIAAKFGELIYERIILEIVSSLIFLKKPLLVPIPISKKRLKQRGFNQAELIAREIFSANPEAFTFIPNAILKTKETLSQTKTKSREERLLNLRGCFEIKNAALVKGKNIVLVDDVTTTGATFAEARKTLKKAGGAEVFCIAIAH